jgi:hypothetical protein
MPLRKTSPHQEWTAMRKMIELLDEDQRAILQGWADAAVAVFASALFVGTPQGIVELLG